LSFLKSIIRVGRKAGVERRLAAVMVADVVGYSAQMNADEVGTLRNIKSILDGIVRPAIRSRGGRLVKTTGDGVLADFSSAVDAVACAINIQQQMLARNERESSKLQYRIGINVGDIVIERADIFGDGVNIAARLERLSAPGAICISGTVRDHLQAKLSNRSV
jgi:adenylate cyclase